MSSFNFFLKRPIFVNITFISIILLSIFVVSNIDRMQYPEVHLDTIQIQATYKNASPVIVEKTITNPLEEELKNISGIKQVDSVSFLGKTIITILLKPNASNKEKIKSNIYNSLDKVSLDTADGPQATLQIREITSLLLPTIQLIVTAKDGAEASYEELEQQVKYITKQLKQMRGTTQVKTYGLRENYFSISLKIEELLTKKIDIRSIYSSFINNNRKGALGITETDTAKEILLLDSQRNTIEKIKSTQIQTLRGNVELDDFANIQTKLGNEKVKTFFQKKPSISLLIRKDNATDIIQFNGKIIEFLEKQKFPDNIEVQAIYDQSKTVAKRISILQNNALLGLMLVLLSLLVFFHPHVAFLISLSLPVSISFTIICMYLFDIGFNIISLSGIIIAMGMIVDQSIIVGEHIILSCNKKDYSIPAILKALQQIAIPVTSAVFTTIIAFLPILAMQGTIAKFIYQLPILVSVGLLASAFNSFFLLPSQIYQSSAKRDKRKTDYFKEKWIDKKIEQLKQAYQKLLQMGLRTYWLISFIAIAFFAFSLIFAAKSISISLFPADGAEEFHVYLELFDNATISTTERKARIIEDEIEQIASSSIKHLIRRIGTNTTDEIIDPIGGEENKAYISVVLINNRVQTIEDVTQTLYERLYSNDALLKDVKALNIEIQKLGPPVGKPIDITISSTDNDKRRELIPRMIDYLENYKGVYDVTSNLQDIQGELVVEIDHKKIAAFGLSAKDVEEAMQIAFSTKPITSFYDGKDKKNIIIEIEDTRKEILNLGLYTPRGQFVSIDNFAKLVLHKNENVIFHRQGERSNRIYAEVNKNVDKEKLIRDVRKAFEDDFSNNSGLFFSYGGEAKEIQESLQSLFIAFAIGVIIIFLLLIALFNSLIHPILILATIPFAFIGVIWSFYIASMPFTFISLVGVVGLSGIVVNNSLLMLIFINRRIKEQFHHLNLTLYNQKDWKEIISPCIVDGASDRFKAIMITTLTTIIGLIPTAYNLGGIDHLIRPIAFVMVWGLLCSSIISLFVLPALYLSQLHMTFFVQKCFYIFKGFLFQRKSDSF